MMTSVDMPRMFEDILAAHPETVGKINLYSKEWLHRHECQEYLAYLVLLQHPEDERWAAAFSPDFKQNGLLGEPAPEGISQAEVLRRAREGISAQFCWEGIRGHRENSKKLEVWLPSGAVRVGLVSAHYVTARRDAETGEPSAVDIHCALRVVDGVFAEQYAVTQPVTPFGEEELRRFLAETN